MGTQLTAQQAQFRMSRDSSAFLMQLGSGTRSRQLPTSIAIAMVVAAVSDLPNAAIPDPQTHFLTQTGTAAAEVVGVLNEIVPIDFKTVLEVAKNLWSMRYETAFTPFGSFGYDLNAGVASVFGLKNHLSNDVIECIEKNAIEITGKYRRFKEIFVELKKD